MSRGRVLEHRTGWAGASAGASVPANPGQPDTMPARAPLSKTRNRLFIKYVVLFVAVVCVALLANGTLDIFFSIEHKAALVRIQREQAEAAAARIGQFIREIESQLGWTTQLPWSARARSSSAASMPCACCVRCRRSRSWLNSMPWARSACACRVWRWTWSIAAPTLPLSRSLPRLCARCITDRYIPARNPSRI